MFYNEICFLVSNNIPYIIDIYIYFLFQQWQDGGNYGGPTHQSSYGTQGPSVREIPIIHQNPSTYPQTNNQQYGQNYARNEAHPSSNSRQIPIVRENMNHHKNNQTGSNAGYPHQQHPTLQQPQVNQPTPQSQQSNHGGQPRWGSDQSRSSSGSPTVRDIPIVRESGPPKNIYTAAPTAPPKNNTYSAAPTAIPPIVNEDVKREYSASPVIDRLKTAEQDPARRSPSPAPAHLTPLEHIATIQDEADKVQNEVGTFTGVKTDKSYRFLDEMLTRLLIKLDRIDSNGDPDIREARRRAVRSVQSSCDQLELKVMANMSGNNNNNSHSSVQQGC